MTGYAQPQYHGAAAVQGFAQRAHAVGGVGEAVQQQNAGPRLFLSQLEAAIPVDRPASRIGKTAPAVAVDGMLRPHRDLGVDQPVQLLEQAVFQGQVLAEIR